MSIGLQQRTFIREDTEKASVPRELYKNFKDWVKEKHPNGISEENWLDILDADCAQQVSMN